MKKCFRKFKLISLNSAKLVGILSIVPIMSLASQSTMPPEEPASREAQGASSSRTPVGKPPSPWESMDQYNEWARRQEDAALKTALKLSKAHRKKNESH